MFPSVDLSVSHLTVAFTVLYAKAMMVLKNIQELVNYLT